MNCILEGNLSPLYDFSMNKLELRQTIIDQLEQKLAVAHSSAQRAIESATDDETVSEHKYDTLATEAAYLAHGQAMRIHDSKQEIHQIANLMLPDSADKVSLGTLITLVDEHDSPSYFFVAPCAGGLKVDFDQMNIMLVTFESPLGKAIRGQQVGDEVSYSIAGVTHWYEIDAIL